MYTCMGHVYMHMCEYVHVSVYGVCVCGGVGTVALNGSLMPSGAGVYGRGIRVTSPP